MVDCALPVLSPDHGGEGHAVDGVKTRSQPRNTGGRSLAEVRDAAGHANVSTTSVYTHIVTDGDEPGDIFDFGCE